MSMKWCWSERRLQGPNLTESLLGRLTSSHFGFRLVPQFEISSIYTWRNFYAHYICRLCTPFSIDNIPSVDDNEYESSDSPILRIPVHTNYVQIEYNQNAFTEHNDRSICRFVQRTKSSQASEVEEYWRCLTRFRVKFKELSFYLWVREQKSFRECCSISQAKWIYNRIHKSSYQDPSRMKWIFKVMWRESVDVGKIVDRCSTHATLSSTRT